MVRLLSNDNQVSFSYWCILYLKEPHTREGDIICTWIRSCRNLYPVCSRETFVQDFWKDTPWPWTRGFLRLFGSGSPSVCQCHTCYGAVSLSVSYQLPEPYLSAAMASWQFVRVESSSLYYGWGPYDQPYCNECLVKFLFLESVKGCRKDILLPSQGGCYLSC